MIADAKLPDGDWKGLLAGLAGLCCPPSLIVSSCQADEVLWAEVLNLGGYDVLLTPFDSEEVFRVGGAAWLEWRRRLEGAAIPVGKSRASASGTPMDRPLAAGSGI